MEIYRSAITEVRDEGGYVRSYFFSAPEGFDWREGTHIHVALPGFDAQDAVPKQLVRHMSLQTLPEEGRMGFVTRLDSSGSVFKRRLATLEAGDKIALFKPGSYLALRRDGRRVTVFSMGVAMGCVRPIALRYAQDPAGVPALTSVTVSARPQFLFEEELSRLRAPGLTLRHLRGRGELPEAIDREAARADTLFCAVGSDDFVCGVVRRLSQNGVPDSGVVLDMKPEKQLAFYEKYGL